MARALRQTDLGQVPLFCGEPVAPVLLTKEPMGRFKLRDYQATAVTAIRSALEVKRSTVAVLATGTGKAIIAAEMGRIYGGCLGLADRDSLVKQMAQKLRHHTSADVSIEKAERVAYGADYIVASVQSLRGARLKRFVETHPRVGVILDDECHHSTSRTRSAILEAFPGAKVIGFSATPDRGDGVGLWNVYDKADTEHGAAYCYDMRQAIDDAWLTNFDYRPVFAPIDLGAIKAKSTGNLDEVALDIQVAKQAGEIAKALIESCHGRTLGFTTGVMSAEVTAEALNRLRPGCARSVHGGMDDLEKERITKAHQRGDFDFLLNCAIYIEGYDDPGLMNVFDAALTKSRARHAQKVGRGTRLWPHGIDHLTTKEERHAAIAASPKPRWNYFHLNGLGGRHDLATPVDLLGGTATPDERALAKRILAKAGGSVDGALAEAKARLEHERARLAAQAAREAEARRVAIGEHRDPFHLLHMPAAAPSEMTGEPASDAQKRRLRELGVRVPEFISKGQASRLIGTCMKRRTLGLANVDQIARLHDIGVGNGHRLSASRAQSIISAHHEKQRAKRLPWLSSWGGKTVEIPDRSPGSDGD